MSNYNLQSLRRKIQRELLKYDSFMKPNVIGINMSSTFLVRTKCSVCHKSPDMYYWVNQPALYYDARSAHAVFDWFKKYIKRINISYYKKYQPKHFTLLRTFNVYWTEKSYKPGLHQHVGIGVEENIVEYLSCPCGTSVWAFAQESSKNRIEIRNRKARYSYPQKFDSY